MVGHKQSILDNAGIDCFIQNEHTSATFGAGALGLVKLPIFDPVLCILDDARYDEAMALLRDVAGMASEARADWPPQSAGSRCLAILRPVGIVLPIACSPDIGTVKG